MLSAEIDRQASQSGGEGADTAKATATTIKNTTVALQFLKTIPGFYKGAEYVSDSTAPNRIPGASRDPFLIRAHGGERIIKDDDNKRLKGISNPTLTDLGESYLNGNLGDWMPHSELATSVVSPNYVVTQSDPALLHEMKGMRSDIATNTNAIKNIPDRSLAMEYDQFGEAMMVETVKTQSKTLINKYKLNQLPGFIKWAKGEGYRG